MVIGVFSQWIAVTAGADPLPTGPTESIYVGAAGTITVTTPDGTSAAIPAVAGAILPVKATHITSLGAATGVFALYR
jgi:hypothetical protein